MDENYLDNLLNEFSLDKEMDHKIEDELDNQIREEKRQKKERDSISREDAFNMDLEQDANQAADTGDLHFSEAEINELDQLDNLADLDIGDLDFSDLDFNDLDVTNLDDVQGEDLDDILKDFEGDLKIDDYFAEEGSKGQQSEEKESETYEYAKDSTQHIENLNEDTFDAERFLDSLLEEPENAEADRDSVVDLQKASYDTEGMTKELNDFGEVQENLDVSGMEQQGFSAGDESQGQSSADGDDALDDLFSLLNLDEEISDEIQIEGSDSDVPADMDVDVQQEAGDSSHINGQQVNRKKSLTQVMFGDPDEDDELSEEELAELDKKKAEKRAKKQAKKERAEAAKEKKASENKQKQKENDQKKRLKAEKRAKQKAEELANAEPERKLNKPAVIFIFTLFLGGTLLFFVGTSNINYAQTIEKAANYFSSQKYRSAYDEIIGVDIKEKDQQLKDRIYTVMYVERLYEAYENNIELGREEKALDSLLRGIDKYYEHYEEAAELGITSDLDYSFSQVQTALLQRYGISVEQAVELNKLDNYQYVQAIKGYIANVSDVNSDTP